MSNLHKFTDHDKTEQGQKAIALGIKNKQSSAENSYDYTAQEAADFSWPDIDPDQIGHIEPWLCYGKNNDGTTGGWVDLNQFANGQERKLNACLQTLGYPEALNTTTDRAREILDEINNNDNFEEIAAQYGFKSNEHFSLEDHVASSLIKIEKAEGKAYDAADDFLKEQKAKLDAQMDAHIEAAEAGGLLDPINGIDMETWAAANAKIAGGMDLEEVLKVVGTEKPIWDEVSAEWTARMSQDTTFAISKVYGDAFMNSNIGKFAATETNEVADAVSSSGGSSLDNVMEDFDLYIKIMCHQNMGATQGKDAVSILNEYGLNVNDWSTVGAQWTTKMATDTRLALKMGELMEKYNAEFATAGAGDDIDF
ncbi:DUF6620 family protein [uncultured Aquimarina sp.]|uniref:DUF6620 family protein n=1 Tax=uncultured Aquimarina sp. TaxID=575652 RepID=UPI00262DDFE4|nr:DUF6620 family protein [uncultured Aquimarina sp.]